jgi:hypothetical protein
VAGLERLSGGFLAAAWDPVRARLVVVRDALGLHPCYYSWSGTRLTVSSSVDALLAQPGADRAFNRVVIAEYVQDRMPHQQRTETFYRDIRRLPAAHVLTLDRSGLGTRCYWDPLPPGFSWVTDEEWATFPDRLDRAVRRALNAGADSIALSGGYDSVSLAVSAARQRNGASPLHAVSLRFPGAECDEGDVQTQVARALGMPLLMRAWQADDEPASLVSGALSASAFNPCPVLSVWQSMYSGLFEAAVSLGLRRMMFGTGGDETLCVDPSFGADCLARFDLAGLWRVYDAFRRTSPYSAMTVARVVLWGQILRPEVRSLLKRAAFVVAPARAARLLARRRARGAVAPWVSRSDRNLVGTLETRRMEEWDINVARGERSYVQVLRSLLRSPRLLLEIDQQVAWSRRTGFGALLPFFDRDLIGLLLRAHPDRLLAGGLHKAPVRGLVRERLPSVRLPVRKVDFTLAVHRVLRLGAPPAWGRFAGNLVLAALDLVEPAAVGRFMADYFEGRHDDSHTAWAILSTEAWLRARS